MWRSWSALAGQLSWWRPLALGVEAPDPGLLLHRPPAGGPYPPEAPGPLRMGMKEDDASGRACWKRTSDEDHPVRPCCGAASDSVEKITYCVVCGAYAWRNHKLLAQPCGGSKVKGLKNQRCRLEAGQFPHAVRAGWTLRNPRTLRATELHHVWLATGKPFLQTCHLGSRKPSWMEPTAYPAKRELLLAFGVDPDAEDDFLAWARCERADRCKAHEAFE